MNSAKAIEFQVTRQLLDRSAVHPPVAPRSQLQHSGAASSPRFSTRWGDRLIAVLAVTVSLIVVGSYLEELIWVVLAAGTIFSLGVDK